MSLKSSVVIVLTVGLGCVLGARPAAAAPGYQYFVVGNPADVVTPTSGLLVLQGGGTDVDENFVRMGARVRRRRLRRDPRLRHRRLQPLHPRPVLVRLRGDDRLQEPQGGLRRRS